MSDTLYCAAGNKLWVYRDGKWKVAKEFEVDIEQKFKSNELSIDFK